MFAHEKAEANQLYEKVLRDIILPLLGNKTTLGSDLKKVGMKLFSTKFIGAFPADMIPDLTKKQPYAIINLDDSDLPGSHWIAISRTNCCSFRSSQLGKCDKRSSARDCILVYDSFGRPTAEILPSLIKKVSNAKLLMVDDDPEQGISETNCGARCMAWLYVFDRYGSDVAELI